MAPSDTLLLLGSFAAAMRPDDGPTVIAAAHDQGAGSDAASAAQTLAAPSVSLPPNASQREARESALPFWISSGGAGASEAHLVHSTIAAATDAAMLGFVDLDQETSLSEKPVDARPAEPARPVAEVPKSLSNGLSSSPAPGGAPGATASGGGSGGGAGAASHVPPSVAGTAIGAPVQAAPTASGGGTMSPMDGYDPGPPTASDQSVSGNHDMPISGMVSASGGSGGYNFSVDTGPSDGQVTMDQSGNFTYTPNYHFYGSDSFTFIATDTYDGEASNVATVSITVNETAPVAANYTYTILHDQVFGVAAPGVLQNCTDAEADPLTATLDTGPANANDFELNSDESWAYLPNDGFLGDNSFTYTVSDGILTATGTVTIHVVDQKPVAVADQYIFSSSDTQETVNAGAGVLTNDTDPDGDSLKSYVETAPSSGSLTLNADGSFTYTPVPSDIANGATITFSYHDSDGAMYGNDATVTMYFIHVSITNPVPSNGGPINQPAELNNGMGNEFTFSSASPGVLTIDVQANLTPDVQAVRDNVDLAVSADSIGGSIESDTGFKYENGQWTDTLSYTGLPDNNSDFGNKQLTVYAMANLGSAEASDSVPYQVFFNRTATNHPGGDDTDANTTSTRSPNWYHYWSQVIGRPDLYYNSTLTVAGRTPAMKLWSADMPWAKDEIWIGPDADSSDQILDGSTAYGIDLLANIIAHEAVHVQQIAAADALLGQYLGQPGYEGGWSWDTLINNHSIPDGMGGMIGLDLINNNTGAVGFDNIPDSWGKYDIEGVACKAETIANNTYWQSDWAAPGKQHARDQVDSD